MFKLNDKVKIISKSYYGDLDSSYIYKNGKKKGIWYICTVEKIILEGEEITRYAVTHRPDWETEKVGGDYFLKQDLIPFNYDILEDELFEI